MGQPEPPSSLDNSCSVIHDNTLYVYTPEAFLSIRLEEGAEWEELSYGESVEGATCVGASPPDPDAAGFWVVGGVGGSTGLQKYTFSSGEWSSPSPRDDVVKDRQHHSSVYIKANDEILVFAGTRDGSASATLETFSIDASEPYGVSSHDPNGAPNAVRPYLLSWTDADALMVGGGAENTKVFLFNPTAGWRDFGASLADPLTKDATQVGAALAHGSDGSQNLYLFDMSESPNKVTRAVLQDGSGTPILNSPTLFERSLETRQDDNAWPSYNDTLAPETTRQNFGMAQGSDGMIVFTGGNDQEPLGMFNGLENKWMNATGLLVEEEIKAQSLSSSSTGTSTTSTSISTSTESSFMSTTMSTATSTSTDISSTLSETAAATTTDAAADGSNDQDSDDGGLGTGVVLGITLGSIFAFLVILALALFCLRRRKLKHHKAAGTTGGDGDQDRSIMPEKNPAMFTDIPQKPPPSPGHFRGHNPQGSADSYSSMAILMGRMNQPKGSARKGSNESGRHSVASLHKHFKSTISKPIPQDDSNPILGDERNGTSDPDAMEPQSRNRNLVPTNADGTRRSSGWNRYWSGGSSLQILGFGGKRNTSASDQSSQYSQSSGQNPSRTTQDSATVPPLNFGGMTAMNRVNSGSPVVTGHGHKLPFGEGIPVKIERPSSRASSGGYSSGIPESVNEAWDPTGSDAREKSWGHDRAPSSVYNSGFNFGTALAPSDAKRPSPPSGVSQQPQLSMASKSSDMSWLNLGDQNRDQNRYTQWPATGPSQS
ncbi:pre-mRNA splicing factor CLF1 [Emericellopsis atlantica]|uniref:Pre-mRNA splicing factor CLF1 n=1 Tax=Emericellopsis atlantica TaxID=2614577 RepID=A0A9P7ZDL4_9HYPO|nr:pre-mRNA splicing factor CLF1 [Emericellopsis atlantica]KAG9249513.1 pre-mRNA splicing factor CLF1 [Emericellopsis atlantica]